APLRERAQAARARHNDPSVYYIHRLADPDALTRPWWHIFFPLWTGTMVAVLMLGLVWPGLFLVAAIGYAVNLFIRIITSRRIGGEIVSFRQVGPLLSTASMLTALDNEETAAVTSSMKPDLAALRRLG